MSPIFRCAAASVWMLLPSLANADTQPSAAPLFTIHEAVQEALAKSPRVASADAAVNAAKGGRVQAGAMPNPGLGIEGENIGGSGSYKGVDSAEITFGLSQQIELGGKRSARKDVADKRLSLAVFDAAITRLDVGRDVKQAFATAIAAQESLKLAENALDISQQELKSVSRRVAEAASPLIQKSKAEVTLATAKFNVEQARQEQTVARTRLATLLGRPTIPETLDASSFFKVTEPVAASDEAIESTPDMLRLRLEEDRANGLLDIEKAASVPDPVVSLGVRELRASSDRAFVVGLTIPIPVLDSNRGNIDQARAEVVRTASEQQSARLTLLQRYAATKSALHTAYIKVTSYSTTVLPAAEQSFSLSRQGYGAGKFQYLEVLDAQRTLFDSRAQYMSALRDYHIQKAELERLTTPYSNATNKEDESHDTN